MVLEAQSRIGLPHHRLKLVALDKVLDAARRVTAAILLNRRSSRSINRSPKLLRRTNWTCSSMSSETTPGRKTYTPTTPDERIARVKVQGLSNIIDGFAVWEASTSEVRTKVNEWKHPEFEEGQRSNDKPADPATVYVAVMNGSGEVVYAAEDLADALRERRYNARAAGNADDFSYGASVVYYSDGFRDPADKIRDLIGGSATTAPLDAADANGNEVAVVAGRDWDGTLEKAPKPEARAPADTVEHDQPRPGHVPGPARPRHEGDGAPEGRQWLEREDRARLPRQHGLRQQRPAGGEGRLPGVHRGGSPRYGGIEMTSAKNTRSSRAKTGEINSGGREYLTYYDGRNLQRIAFTVGGVTYWVSNTLENDLSANTVQEIAKSMRPLNRAKLKKGRTDTAITVETEGSTP